MRHLLVVDDELHLRDLLRKYLELERHTVDLAENSREAWRKLTNVEYDCILLDLNMPGMSGPEIYRLIQETMELGFWFPASLGTGCRCDSDRVWYLRRVSSVLR